MKSVKSIPPHAESHLASVVVVVVIARGAWLRSGVNSLKELARLPKVVAQVFRKSTNRVVGIRALGQLSFSGWKRS